MKLIKLAAFATVFAAWCHVPAMAQGTFAPYVTIHASGGASYTSQTPNGSFAVRVYSGVAQLKITEQAGVRVSVIRDGVCVVDFAYGVQPNIMRENEIRIVPRTLVIEAAPGTYQIFVQSYTVTQKLHGYGGIRNGGDFGGDVVYKLVLGSLVSHVRSIISDKQGPVLTASCVYDGGAALSQADAWTARRGATVTASATDAICVANAPTLTVNGVPAALPWKPAEDGTYALAITSYDVLGNGTTVYKKLVYDGTAPEFSNAPDELTILELTRDDVLVLVHEEPYDASSGLKSVDLSYEGVLDSEPAEGGYLVRYARGVAASIELRAIDLVGNQATIRYDMPSFPAAPEFSTREDEPVRLRIVSGVVGYEARYYVSGSLETLFLAPGATVTLYRVDTRADGTESETELGTYSDPAALRAAYGAGDSTLLTILSAFDGVAPRSVSFKIVQRYVPGLAFSIETSLGKARPLPSERQTRGGTLEGDEAWIGSATIDGDLVVPFGATLLIERDCLVAVAGGARLTVYGTLLVREGAKLVGLSGAAWKGIALYGSAELEGAELRDAERAIAIGTRPAMPGGLEATLTGTLDAKSCAFTDCGIGVHLVAGRATLVGCSFLRCDEYGIKQEFQTASATMVGELIEASCAFAHCAMDRYR